MITNDANFGTFTNIIGKTPFFHAYNGDGIPLQSLCLVNGHQHHVDWFHIHGGSGILDLAQGIDPRYETAEIRILIFRDFLGIRVDQRSNRVHGSACQNRRYWLILLLVDGLSYHGVDI